MAEGQQAHAAPLTRLRDLLIEAQELLTPVRADAEVVNRQTSRALYPELLGTLHDGRLDQMVRALEVLLPAVPPRTREPRQASQLARATLPTTGSPWPKRRGRA